MNTKGGTRTKRMAAVLLVLIVTVALMTALAMPTAAATSGTCGENLTWTLDDSGTLTISGNGEMGNDVPWSDLADSITAVSIKNSVKRIGDYAFYLCTNLTEVTMPDSVTAIGNFAFYSCRSLIKVTIPDGVTTIGDSAFADCDSLTKVTIGNSVTTIGRSAFCSCESLTSVTIPNSVTKIEDSAFSYCKSLTAITIGNSVTLIGWSAFRSCESLTSVKIPNSVITIEERAFCECAGLTALMIGESVTTIEDAAFSFCDSLNTITVDNGNKHYTSDASGVLFDKSKTILVQYPTGKTNKSYTIPGSVITIGTWAFSKCSNLTIITIPDSVKTIRMGAFAYCRKIKNIAMGKDVKSITIGAFDGCDSLINVYYAGTQAEWEAILIAADNVPFTAANIYFNSKPKNMRYEVAERKIIIFSDESFLNSKMVMAVYRAKELIDFKTSSVDIAEGEIRIPCSLTDFGEADTVKVMLWNSTGVTPLMGALEITP